MSDAQIKEKLEEYGKRTGRNLTETCNYLMTFIPKATLDKMTGKTDFEKAFIAMQVKNGTPLEKVMY